VVREIGATIAEEAGEDGAVIWETGSTFDDGEVEQGIEIVAVLVMGDDAG
jgi:hypothetical protein